MNHRKLGYMTFPVIKGLAVSLWKQRFPQGVIKARAEGFHEGCVKGNGTWDIKIPKARLEFLMNARYYTL